MKKITSLILVTGAFALCAQPESFAADTSSKFTVCTACHLADGAGVPGVFPPIAGRSTAIASLEGGREYLVSVVSFGLMGNIDVGGATYAGIMPGHLGQLSAEDIAGALNHLVFELAGETKTEDLQPFTAEEVTSVQESATARVPADVVTSRAQLVEKHGDAWPH